MSETSDPKIGASMTETAKRRSPAARAASDGRTTALERHFASAKPAAEARVEICLLSGRRYLNVRLDPLDGRAVEAAERVLDQPMPLIANTFTTGDHRIFWLGPNEWLIETAVKGAAGLGGELTGALDGFHAAVNDVSGAHVALRVGGADARTVLAKGCTLDLHPREFGPGQCARTGLAKATVLLGALDRSPTYTIIVGSSFADYLCRWLAQAARPPGMSFSVLRET